MLWFFCPKNHLFSSMLFEKNTVFSGRHDLGFSFSIAIVDIFNEIWENFPNERKIFQALAAIPGLTVGITGGALCQAIRICIRRLKQDYIFKVHSEYIEYLKGNIPKSATLCRQMESLESQFFPISSVAFKIREHFRGTTDTLRLKTIRRNQYDFVGIRGYLTKDLDLVVVDLKPLDVVSIIDCLVQIENVSIVGKPGLLIISMNQTPCVDLSLVPWTPTYSQDADICVRTSVLTSNALYCSDESIDDFENETTSICPHLEKISRNSFLRLKKELDWANFRSSRHHRLSKKLDFFLSSKKIPSKTFDVFSELFHESCTDDERYVSILGSNLFINNIVALLKSRPDRIAFEITNKNAYFVCGDTIPVRAFFTPELDQIIYTYFRASITNSMKIVLENPFKTFATTQLALGNSKESDVCTIVYKIFYGVCDIFEDLQAETTEVLTIAKKKKIFRKKAGKICEAILDIIFERIKQRFIQLINFEKEATDLKLFQNSHESIRRKTIARLSFPKL